MSDTAHPPGARAGRRALDAGRTPATVLVVDDDGHVRGLLRRMIEASDLGLMWVGEASDGTDALSLYAELRPRIVILDHWMPGLDGLAVARLLLQAEPGVHIVLFSAAIDGRVLAEAAEIGIADIVSKTDSEALCSTLGELAQRSAR